MRQLAAILSWFGWGGGYLLLALAVLITIDVSLRTLFNRPITGAYEVSVISLLYITFLVLGWIQYSRRQMRIDVLSKRVTGRPGKVLEIISNLLGLIFFGLILWRSVLEWILAWQKQAVGRGLVEIPDVIPLSGLVIGSAAISLGCLAGSLRGVWGIIAHRRAD